MMALVEIHAHARLRMEERGVTEAEILQTIKQGEMLPAKQERSSFRCDFPFGGEWQGLYYETKQVEVICAENQGVLIVVTVISRFF